MIDYRIWLAFVILVGYSLGDILAKKIVVKLNYALSAMVITGIGIVPFLLAAPFAGAQGITLYSILLSAVAGLFYGGGFIMLYKALSTEQTTNTMALSEFFKGCLVVIGIFAFGEALATLQYGGILMIFLGALLIITTEKLKINRKLVYALSGFVMWAVLWTLIAVAVKDSNSYLYEGLILNLVAFLACLAYSAYSSRRLVKGGNMVRFLKRELRGHTLNLSLLIGLAVGIGGLVFCYLILYKMLAAGAAIIALTPVTVAIASRKMYLDKLTVVQLLGLLIMVIGALALSLG